MSISLIQTVVLAASFLGGFVGAVAGGGGLVLLPALLISGTPTSLLIGTNKLLSVFTTLPSALIYLRKLRIDLRQWLIPIAFTAIGAIVSVLVIRTMPLHYLNYLLGSLLLVSAFYTFFSEQIMRTAEKSSHTVSATTKNGCCFGISCFSSVVGAGAGILWVNLLVGLFKLDLLSASGIARMLSFISNLIAFCFYATFDLVNFHLGLLMAVGVVSGSACGSYFAISVNKKWVKLIMMIVAIASSIVLFLKD